MKKLVSALFILGSLASFGCSGGGEDLPEVDCETVTVPTYSQVTALDKCTTCHSSTLTTPVDRNNAEEGYNFDTYEGAVEHATAMVDEVYHGSMPPAGEPDLTEAEKDQLYAWGLCGTPE